MSNVRDTSYGYYYLPYEIHTREEHQQYYARNYGGYHQHYHAYLMIDILHGAEHPQRFVVTALRGYHRCDRHHLFTCGQLDYLCRRPHCGRLGFGIIAHTVAALQ